MEYLFPELLELVSEELNTLDRYFLSRTNLTPSLDIKNIAQEDCVKRKCSTVRVVEEGRIQVEKGYLQQGRV